MRPHLDEDIHSLSEFKRNTAAMMRRMKRTKRPLVLTVNGKAALVVNDPAEYERMVAKMEHDQTVAGIKAGLEDVKAGRMISLDDFLEKMNAQVLR